MGCQSEAEVGNTLVFSVNTHNPTTGVAADADSVPAYRVYEDTTGTAILSGSMAKLDDDNTTGFYAAQFTCSAANGFEANKSYTIYVSAVVATNAITYSYSFRVRAAPLSAADVNSEVDDALSDYGVATPSGVWAASARTLTQSAVDVATTVAGSKISIFRGDTASISITGLGDISNYSKIWFTVKRDKANTDAQSLVQIAETLAGLATDGLQLLNGEDSTLSYGSITIDDATLGNITIAIDEAATVSLLARKGCHYDVQVLRSTGAVNTLTSGRLDINADITRAVE